MGWLGPPQRQQPGAGYCALDHDMRRIIAKKQVAVRYESLKSKVVRFWIMASIYKIQPFYLGALCMFLSFSHSFGETVHSGARSLLGKLLLAQSTSLQNLGFEFGLVDFIFYWKKVSCALGVHSNVPSSHYRM